MPNKTMTANSLTGTSGRWWYDDWFVYANLKLGRRKLQAIRLCDVNPCEGDPWRSGTEIDDTTRLVAAVPDLADAVVAVLEAWYADPANRVRPEPEFVRLARLAANRSGVGRAYAW